MDIKEALKRTWVKNGDKILIGLSIASHAATGIAASRDHNRYRKAVEDLESERARIRADQNDPNPYQPLDWKDKLKIGVGCYAPTIILTVGGISADIAYAKCKSDREKVLLTMANSAAAGTLLLKDSIKEVVTPKQAEEIQQKVMEKKIEQGVDTPTYKKAIEKTANFDDPRVQLCYDNISDKFFWASPDQLRKAELEMDRMIQTEGSAYVSDWYHQLVQIDESLASEFKDDDYFSGLKREWNKYGLGEPFKLLYLPKQMSDGFYATGIEVPEPSWLM